MNREKIAKALLTLSQGFDELADAIWQPGEETAAVPPETQQQYAAAAPPAGTAPPPSAGPSEIPQQGAAPSPFVAPDTPFAPPTVPAALVAPTTSPPTAVPEGFNRDHAILQFRTLSEKVGQEVAKQKMGQFLEQQGVTDYNEATTEQQYNVYLLLAQEIQNAG